MIIFFYGILVIKIIVLLVINYYVLKFFVMFLICKFWFWLIICGNMVIFLFNEIWEGYKFGSLYVKFGVLVSEFYKKI